MAIAYVSSTTAEAAYRDTTLTLSVPAPASIVSGNLLLLCVYVQGVLGGPTDPGVGTPTGWTLKGSGINIGAGNQDLYVFSKVATGSEPASYTLTWTNQSNVLFVTLLQYSGTSGVDGTPVFAGAATTTVSSVSATGANEMWVSGFGSVATTLPTAPTGWSDAVTQLGPSSGVPNDWVMGTADKALTSSGATGTATWTSSVSGSTFSLVLTPGSVAPAAVTVTVPPRTLIVKAQAVA